MIRETKPTAELRRCQKCGKPPLVLHDLRRGGSYSVDDPRCGTSTESHGTQAAAERAWGYAEPKSRGVLTLRAMNS